jgi:putative (di)nucleoside polyphosphate hydrolase
VIDSEGYRANVGIILCNEENCVFWAKRVKQDAWQFPQGGIRENETEEQALYRELEEEIGLRPEHVKVLGSTRHWLRYRLPEKYIRYDSKPVCIGQKQRWFLLRLIGKETDVRLDLSDKPEFDEWRWVDYWHPLQQVISFKREVYRLALSELSHILTIHRPKS